MEFDPRKAIGESRDSSRDQLIDERRTTTDPQFPHCRVGQERDLPHASSQLIKYGDPAIEECSTIARRLDALRGPIKENIWLRWMLRLRYAVRAGRREVDLARIGLGIGDELRHGLGWDR